MLVLNVLLHPDLPNKGASAGCSHCLPSTVRKLLMSTGAGNEVISYCLDQCWVILYFHEGPSVQVLKQNYNSNFDSENQVPHKLNQESSYRFGSSKNNYSDSRFGTSFQSQT